ncbi:hypothetical protein HHI36_009990 [Cryptolaemus montrouzieri]|uniref:DUF4200 domain-containing protein n=1 Tax=Cryptolaemus montrouzieri TaxID=559131 RepID=A0ABD2MHF7_9CUCU
MITRNIRCNEVDLRAKPNKRYILPGSAPKKHVFDTIGILRPTKDTYEDKCAELADDNTLHINLFLRETSEKLNKLLVRRRENVFRLLDIVNAKWENLEIKEEEFRKLFINFNKFLKSNIEKRERFEQNSNRNQQNIKRKEYDIRLLKAQLVKGGDGETFGKNINLRTE